MWIFIIQDIKISGSQSMYSFNSYLVLTLKPDIVQSHWLCTAFILVIEFQKGSSFSVFWFYTESACLNVDALILMDTFVIKPKLIEMLLRIDVSNTYTSLNLDKVRIY